MRRTALALVALLLAYSAPAFAGGGAKGDWELGIYGGYGWPDDYGPLHPKKHFLYGGRLGYFFSDAISLEGSAQRMKTHTEPDTLLLPGAIEDDFTMSALRLNLLYNMGHPGAGVRPFLTLGIGSERAKLGESDSDSARTKGLGWNAGLGFRFFPSPSWNIRLEGRYVSAKTKDLLNERQKNWEGTLGLSVLFGGHHGEHVSEVVHENGPPTASVACEKPELGAGESMTVTATASDPDNDVLTYDWAATAGTVTGNGATATFTFGSATPPASSTITVKVSDTHGHTTSADCAVSMRAPAPPPEAVSCLAGGFPRNLSRLNNVDKACLDDVAQRLKSDPQAHVIVIGYADSHEKTPDALGQARAKAVNDYLVNERGIEASRVTVRSGAANKPVGTGADLAAQSQNRRCEVWFVPQGAKDPD